MEEHIIYKLVSPHGKVYIGQTNNFNGRMAEHKSNSKWRKTKLYNSIRYRIDLRRYNNPLQTPVIDSVRIKFKHIDNWG